MKKIGLILSIACVSLTATAQNVIDIYSTGPSGSFTTGNATSGTRVDNTITVQNAPTRHGYAVFDLDAIPSSAIVTNVELHFNKESVTGFTGGGGYSTRGYLGDLSTVTVPATLFANMGSAPTIFTSSYGGGTGNTFLPNNPPATTFIDTNIGREVSIIWTTTTFRTYNITGETGAATTTGTHAPFLRVTYNCPDITSITASGPSVTPCPNTAFTLSGAATGEIAGYAWNGPFGFTSTLANPTVTAGLPASGMYTLTVTDTSGCSMSVTTLVSVFSAPSSVVSASTVAAFCDGDSATLDVAVSPGGSYQWFNNEVLIPGATNSTYVTYGTGNYKAQVADANGCISMSALAVPTFLISTPSVSPAGPVLLCAGDNGTIAVNTNGVVSGVTFQWQRDGVNIPGSVGSSHVAALTGSYRCVIGVPVSGCVDTSLAVEVDVNSYPSPVVSYSGTALATASVFSSYQWFLNTVSIPGATNFSYVPTVGGSYRVRVTDANGCTAFSGGYPVSTVGIGVLAAASIRVYPNPATDVLRIDAPSVVDVVISSIEGRVMGKYENAKEVRTQNLPKGIYLLSVYSNGERVKVEKITKQ